MYYSNFLKGNATNYCEDAANLTADLLTYTGTDSEKSGLSTLSHTMWVGGHSLAALVADRNSTEIYELRLSKSQEFK